MFLWLTNDIIAIELPFGIIERTKLVAYRDGVYLQYYLNGCLNLYAVPTGKNWEIMGSAHNLNEESWSNIISCTSMHQVDIITGKRINEEVFNTYWVGLKPFKSAMLASDWLLKSKGFLPEKCIILKRSRYVTEKAV